MFSREEARQRRQEFWTAFGIYMRQHASVRGPKIKWVNYKTGIRQLYFRLEADSRRAYVAIDLQHRDAGIRELFYQQWEELRGLLHGMTGIEWDWQAQFHLPDGREISRIRVVLPGVNVFRPDDWALIFEFFAGILVPLDELWAEAVELFWELEA
ncbi:MAG: DUF4268 domain-containing protein [Bacteroidota bacterium]